MRRKLWGNAKKLPGPIIKNLAEIIKVKTLVTLVVIIVFAILALRGSYIPESVMIIVTAVISFYFGTVNERNSGDKK